MTDEIEQAQEQAQEEGVIVEAQEAEEQPTEEQPDEVTAQLNELTARAYAAEARTKELEAKLQTPAQPEQQAAQPQPATPSAPVMPVLTYDAEADNAAMAKYSADMAAHNAAMIEASVAAATQKITRDQQQTAQNAQRQKTLTNYVNNAVAAGVNLETLKAAETTLLQAGVGPELAQYIDQSPEGPAIAVHLYKNPAVMQRVLSLDPISAGAELAAIKATVTKSKPKSTAAPDPIPKISGGGASSTDDYARKYPGVVIM